MRALDFAIAGISGKQSCNKRGAKRERQVRESKKGDEEQ
jgi:hypothetical protein